MASALVQPRPMPLAPTRQLLLVEDHGKLGTYPFKATEDHTAGTELLPEELQPPPPCPAALAVKRQASIEKRESERNAQEMERAALSVQPMSRTKNRRCARRCTHAIGPDPPNALVVGLEAAFGPRVAECPRKAGGGNGNAQTYADWKAEPHPRPWKQLGTKSKPLPLRSTIYLLPLGAFGESAPPLDLLLAWCRAYFMLRVELLPPVVKEAELAPLRTSTRGVLSARQTFQLLYRKLPPDGFCVLGITTAELVADEGKSYLMGLAKLNQRVGVFSLDFDSFGERDVDRSAGWYGRLLRRSIVLMTHEATHMFGVRHCSYFNCRMQDCGERTGDCIEDTDGSPPDICPVCLRKLADAAQFDLTARYRELAAAARHVQQQLRHRGTEADAACFEADAEWLEARVEALEVCVACDRLVFPSGFSPAGTLLLVCCLCFEDAKTARSPFYLRVS